LGCCGGARPLHSAANPCVRAELRAPSAPAGSKRGNYRALRARRPSSKRALETNHARLGTRSSATFGPWKGGPVEKHNDTSSQVLFAARSSTNPRRRSETTNVATLSMGQMEGRPMTRTSSGYGVFALLLACVLGPGLWTRVALAQSEPSACDMAHARELLNQGLHQREIGDISGALEKLRAANSLVRTPILALELGKTYMQLGKLVEARETFLSVARIRVRSEETTRSTAARNESARLADEIRPRLASVTIRVSGATSGAFTVTIDGAAMPAETLGTTRLVDPGAHVVFVQGTDGASSEMRVELAEGETRDVHFSMGTPQLPIPRSATASALPVAGATRSTDNTAPATGASRWSSLFYLGIGLAGAGVVVGTVTGLLSVSKESSVNDACGGGLRCPHSVHDDLQTGRTLADVSTVSFAVAGVGAIVGVLAVVLPRQKEATTLKTSFAPWFAPGGAGIRGTF
jgi:hypothetical protein